VGRAARNINGAAILYADRMTGSMQRALDEMDRRREKQLLFNKVHGITPRGIRKAVSDIMEGAHSGAPGSPQRFAQVADEVGRYGELTPDDVSRRIHEIEKRMFKHAENLEFEEAAKLRDEAARLRDFGLELKAG
jgi:excinuclease ABC subunit B